MSTCYQCKEELVEKTTTLHKKHKGKWFMIEDVPVSVCHRCGESYYDGPMMIKIEEMLEREAVADKEITVPVYKYKVA
jgi:YgiT-type zinc finger domain-containing protein